MYADHAPLATAGQILIYMADSADQAIQAAARLLSTPGPADAGPGQGARDLRRIYDSTSAVYSTLAASSLPGSPPSLSISSLRFKPRAAQQMRYVNNRLEAGGF